MTSPHIILDSSKAFVQNYTFNRVAILILRFWQSKQKVDDYNPTYPSNNLSLWIRLALTVCIIIGWTAEWTLRSAGGSGNRISRPNLLVAILALCRSLPARGECGSRQILCTQIRYLCHHQLDVSKGALSLPVEHLGILLFGWVGGMIILMLKLNKPR